MYTAIQLYSPSDSESARTDAADGGLGGRGFGVGGDIRFLPTNSTYVPGKSPFSYWPERDELSINISLHIQPVYFQGEHPTQLLQNWS